MQITEPRFFHIKQLASNAVKENQGNTKLILSFSLLKYPFEMLLFFLEIHIVNKTDHPKLMTPIQSEKKIKVR